MSTQKEELHMTLPNDFHANILVADPDETLGEFLDVSLRKSQHDVRIVRNGREAPEILRDEYFDLAILELTLPEIPALKILTA
jgi:DNA-binding response OmpR family regulator